MTRTFKAVRTTDVSGISGEGHVADGVTFEDGTTVLRWRTDYRSTAIYESFDHMKKIHGHNGATRFVFDEDEEDDWLEDMLALADLLGKVVGFETGKRHK